MMRIHLSVGQRISLGFFVMILLVVLASGVGLLYSRSAKTSLDSAHNNSAQIEQIRSLQLQWTTVVTLVDNLLLTRQTSLIESQLNPGLAAFNQQLADLQEQNIGQNPTATAKNQEIIKDLQQLGSDLTSIANQITEYAQTGSWARAQALRFTEMSSLQRRLNENLNQLSLNISEGIDEEIISSNAQQSAARAQLIVITIFAVVMSAVLAYFTTRSVTLPVSQLLNNVQRIMNRDFSHQEALQRNDEFGKLSQATNLMTDLLKETYEQLEQRVEARTKDLETVAEVGTATATILDTNQLLQAVVDLTKERFNLYHSHIYLLDDKGENLVLAKGSGEAGRIMASEKRSIPINREQSLVARAARERKGVTVNDVTLAPDFLPNPLLPDTRAELAVPMLVGQTLIGVFDIQSNVAGRFTETDANIQTTLAAQLASSVQNARSFEHSKSQVEFESMVNTISQKIQRTGSVEEALQTAARELGTAIGTSRVKAVITANQNTLKTL